MCAFKTTRKSLTLKDRYNGIILKKNDIFDLQPKNQKYERNALKKDSKKPAAVIVKYAIKNEKSARIMEKNNTLTFIVDVNATKPEIKEAVAELYGAKVMKVNTLIVFKRPQKKAFVRFAEEGAAVAIAEREGIL